jgi:hypothetical protein
MSAGEPLVDPDRVVFATMPGFELVRYPARGGWHLWARASGKEAKVTADEAWQFAVTKDAKVIYGLDGGTRFYAQVHKSNSQGYEYQHHSTVWELVSPEIARKLMPDEPPEILADYRAASSAAGAAHRALMERQREAEAAWSAAVAKVAELPQFQGMDLDVPDRGWLCLESPLQVCIYDDNDEDGYRLRCVICGAPQERD